MASSSAVALPVDRSLPDPDHALPTHDLVNETAKLSAHGDSGIGGGGVHDSLSASHSDGGLITPGQEVPGGFPGGYQAPASPPATTLYEDATKALKTIGEAAYGVVPESLVQKFSAQSISDPAANPIATTTNTVPHQTPSTASSSGDASSIIPTNGAKTDNRSLASSEIPSASAVASNVASLATGALHSVQNMLGFGGAASPKDGHVAGAGGVGDLPGAKDEAGVAVLPLEKKLDNASGQTTSASRGGLAGEHAAEVASAARDSPATSAGAVPLSSSLGTTSANSPLAGSGGLAAIHADEIAAAAKTHDFSHSTELGDKALHDEEARFADKGKGREGASKEDVDHAKQAPLAPLNLDLGAPISGAAIASAVTSSTSQSGPTTGSKDVSQLSGSGGLAAVHADEIATAAKHSSATSAGDVPLTSTPAFQPHPSAPVEGHRTEPAATVTPISAPAPAAGLSSTPLVKTSTAGSSNTSSSTHTGSVSPTSGTHHKKPSLSQKIKGEIKIISGKLGHDEQKIKEGERLKTGEPTL